MGVNVGVNSKKSFSLVEFLVSLLILTLSLIALTNAVVFFMQWKLKNAIASHTADVALELINFKEKLNNCQGVSALDFLQNATYCNSPSSVYCRDETLCEDNFTCIICYINPDTGKKIFYAFNATQLGNETYRVNIYWLFGNYNGSYTTVITIP